MCDNPNQARRNRERVKAGDNAEYYNCNGQVASRRPITTPQEIRILPDKGCHLHPSCFTCPYPECQLDGKDYSEAHKRHAKILRLVKKGGMTEKAIARKVGCSASLVDYVKRKAGLTKPYKTKHRLTATNKL